MCVQWAPGRVCVDLVLAPPSPRLLTRSACPVQPPNRVAMHKPFADCRQCKKARIRPSDLCERALSFFSIKSIIPLITGGSGGFARASSQDFGFFLQSNWGTQFVSSLEKMGKNSSFCGGAGPRGCAGLADRHESSRSRTKFRRHKKGQTSTRHWPGLFFVPS